MNIPNPFLHFLNRLSRHSSIGVVAVVIMSMLAGAVCMASIIDTRAPQISTHYNWEGDYKKAEKERKEALKQAEKERKKALKEAEKARQKALREAEIARQQAQVEREKALEQARIEREKALREAEIERQKALRDAEIARQKAQVEREKALREAEIERQKALRDAEIARQKAQVEREKALEQARIEREEALKQARIEREKALKQARIEREKALKQARIERKKALREAQIERQKAQASNRKIHIHTGTSGNFGATATIMESRSYSTQPFTGIEISGIMHVVYTEAPGEPEVHAYGSKEFIDHLSVTNRDGVLHINLLDAHNLPDTEMRVNVSSYGLKELTMDGIINFTAEGEIISPSLAIKSGGITHINIARYSGGKLSVTSDGISKVHIMNVEASSVEACATGTSEIKLNGICSPFVSAIARDVSTVILEGRCNDKRESEESIGKVDALGLIIEERPVKCTPPEGRTRHMPTEI